MPEPPIPIIDCAAIHRRHAAEIEAAVLATLRSGRYVLGPEVDAFEREMQAFLGSGAVLGVSSGTDAILLALMALDIGPGDEVITTPFTFFATAGTIARTGAKPVFADIEEGTHNLDIGAVERAITPRTKAILPVHLFGRPVAMEPFLRLAKDRRIAVVEDCAQAIGTLDNGVSVGTRSPFGAWSLFPSKNLGAAGDAGFLTVNDPDLLPRAKALRTHGEVARYHHRWIGGNFRIDELQCAILRVKLRYLEAENRARRENAAFYARAIRERGLDGWIRLPGEAPGERHSYHQFTIEIPERDRVAEFLGKRGIGCGVYYPVPLHLQACFQDLGYGPGSFPKAEAAASRVLSLPIHGGLTPGDLERVVDALSSFHRERGSKASSAGRDLV